MRSTIVGLTLNLQHQHSKVRKVTLTGLKDVAIAKGAEPYLKESFPQFRFVQNDRS